MIITVSGVENKLIKYEHFIPFVVVVVSPLSFLTEGGNLKKTRRSLFSQRLQLSVLGGTMSPPLVHWRITRDATNDEAYAILSQDPVWDCFALADLEPPLRDYSQFAIASQDESNECAICLILRHPIIGQVLSPFGRREGVAAILKQLALPERPLIQAQEIHIPLLQRYYQSETTWKSMLRMAILNPLGLPQKCAPSLSEPTH